MLVIQFGYFTYTLEEDFRNRIPPLIEEGVGHLFRGGFFCPLGGYTFRRHVYYNRIKNRPINFRNEGEQHLNRRKEVEDNDRVRTMASDMKYDWPSEALTTPQENELTMLTHSIIEWRKMKEVGDSIRIQMREVNKKMKALEDIILRVMKSHNIGALDLKNSGGRVLFKKSKRQAGLGQKNMEKLITDYLQSEEKAKALMTYVQEHREVIIKESILYEKTD